MTKLCGTNTCSILDAISSQYLTPLHKESLQLNEEYKDPLTKIILIIIKIHSFIC